MPNNESYSAIISTPLSKLGLITESEFLLKIEYVPDNLPLKQPEDATSTQISAELQKYFANPRHEFEASFYFPATDFQLIVWQALREIPSGATMTYGELAKKLRTSPRAIGNACRTNPLPIIIPCHRIVAAHGLGGYAGNTAGKMMEIKQWLLQHESSV